MTTHAPVTVLPPATMGSIIAGSAQFNDIQALNGVFAADDGTARNLDIVTNSAAGSSVTLGAWVAGTTNAVAPILRATSAAVTVTPPLTVKSVTDGTATLTAGNITGAKTVTATTLTDGTATLTAGNITGAKTVTATTLTDGTASLTAGNITGAKTVTATTLTDGTTSLTAGNITGAKTVTATTLTDGTATLTAGNITGAKTVTATTLTDGTARITGGAITASTLTLSGTFAVANIEATNVNIAPSGALYFGGVNAAGSWRLTVSGGALVLQTLGSGTGATYVTRHSFK
jgi:cytoskeletal protein CcmA (bactofilin family)